MQLFHVDLAAGGQHCSRAREGHTTALGKKGQCSYSPARGPWNRTLAPYGANVAFEAERKMGEMLAQTERAKGAKGIGTSAVLPE